MRVILGTYRGPELVERAINSLIEHLDGWDKLTIVDDSGNKDWADHYRGVVRNKEGRPIIPKLVTLPKVGYTQAMGRVCREARNERFMFWEEDFVLTEDVDLRELELILDQRPGLAQVALQRNPHFANEHVAGSMLEALRYRLRPDESMRTEPDGLIIQNAIFTCNPAVWQYGVAPKGWPQAKWSEERKTQALRARGYEFAFLPGIKVHHDGVRSGHGY